ncbi:SDR family NAD(P)-dependent oxidoreductase [Azoarcus taiwanensis]|uniref:SDR family oxidoreductase n=1 Tax=Azoarcus taiwanensis TaxID=666964 RepID=A0A972FHE9_9RHOO|nr:SDR family oxidoreductase [Azoarcus taiwanensis]NMG04785.1 SDR family oxidoreductase [Azoarcus taiwanensis]
MTFSDTFLRLDNKLAVVTGAAGIIGSVIARQLQAYGARVALVDIDAERLDAVEAETPDRQQVRAFRCDLSDAEAITSTVEAINAWSGGIDILFNNAATKTEKLERFFDPVDEYTLETWREVMAVNADGLFVMARECAKSMRRQGGGSIVQTASIYGAMAPDMRIYEGSEYLGRQINTPPIYAASKGAVIALTRYLAALWASDGIRVNTISPGGVSSGQNGVFHEQYRARVPMARMAEAREIADAALFLASPAASYITGQNLMVDGGLSIW